MEEKYTFEMMWEDLNNGYQIFTHMYEIDIYCLKPHQIATHKSY